MKIKKRKYPAVIVRENNKWFTGYCEEYCTGDTTQEWMKRYPLCVETEQHLSDTLSIKYKTYSRGRSAANIIMEDPEGFAYSMSMSSFHDMMVAANNPDNEVVSLNTNGWFIGEFMQIKQGANYFIAVVKENV